MKNKKSIRIILFIILPTLLFVVFSKQGYTALTEENSDISWREWYDSIGNYIKSMSLIMNKGKQVATSADDRLTMSVQNDDKIKGKKIITETGDSLSTITVELLELDPPQELREYHQKIIEAYEYRKLANDAMLRDNLDDYYMYANTAISSEIESLEELIELYQSHGAPEGLINDLQTIIKALNDQFL